MAGGGGVGWGHQERCRKAIYSRVQQLRGEGVLRKEVTTNQEDFLCQEVIISKNEEF